MVEPTNELKAAQVALKVEEQRIFRDLSQMIRKAMPEIKRALEAAAEVCVCAHGTTRDVLQPQFEFIILHKFG